jgi:D-arabinose 1-dehydrogenase-like Zn-dependent alcohol dehydrogenase
MWVSDQRVCNRAASSAKLSVSALQAIRDVRRPKTGQKIPVLGDGGGSTAVGIAKSLGVGSITFVFYTKDVTRVESTGVDTAIDRTQTRLKAEFAQPKFNLMSDSTGKLQLNGDGSKGMDICEQPSVHSTDVLWSVILFVAGSRL